MKRLLTLLFLVLFAFGNAQDIPQYFREGIIIGAYPAHPTGFAEGQIYWNNVEKIYYQYNGTAWEKLKATLEDIEDIASTQIIDLGDIGANTIDEGFNNFTFTGDDDPVQDQADGYVIVKAIRNGTAEDYLFLGEGGSYGTGGTEIADAEDFILLDSSSSYLNSSDVWRNQTATQNALTFEEWIRHGGNVSLDENIYLNGFITSTDNDADGRLQIRGAYGADFGVGNPNHGFYQFNTGAPTSQYGDGKLFNNVILNRNYSFISGTGNIITKSLQIAPTLDFTNAGSSSTYTGIHLNPTITNLNSITHYAILSEQGNVWFKNSLFTVNDYTFPGADGTAGQVLQTDGNGNILFTDPGSVNNNLEKVLINSASITLTASDIEDWKQFIIDPSQTDVTITIPQTAYDFSGDAILFLNIIHEGTGDVTIQGDTGVTLTTRTFTNIKRIVYYSDADDVWKVKEENNTTETGIANILDYGAVMDGTTDDSAAVASAIATGKTVYIPWDAQGVVCTGLTIGTGQKIYGNNSKVIVNSGTCLTLSNYSKVEGLDFVGAGIAVGSTIAIDIDTVKETVVTNCNFDGFSDSAYKIENVVQEFQGNILSNFNIKNSSIGINLEERAEYNKISIGAVHNCTTGIYIRGGNNNISALTVSQNTTGIHVANGVNDAHGIVSDCNINHNTTYGIRVDSTNVESFNFDNCQIWANDVWLNNAKGTIFNSCTFSSCQIQEEGATDCYVYNSTMENNAAVLQNHNTTQSEVYYVNCNVDADSGITDAVIINEGTQTMIKLGVNRINVADGASANLLSEVEYNRKNFTGNFLYLNPYDDVNDNIDGSVKSGVGKNMVFVSGTFNVNRTGSYIPIDEVEIVMEGSTSGIVYRAQYVSQFDDGTYYTNVYRFSGILYKDSVSTEDFNITGYNNTGGTVNFFREGNLSHEAHLIYSGW